MIAFLADMKLGDIYILMRAGFVDVIHKPFTNRIIEDIIVRYMAAP